MSCWTALRSLSAAAQVGILFTLLLVQLGEEVAAAAGSGGSWQVVVQNAGIASMHTAVTHYGKVVLLDRTNIDPSQLPLPPGVCRNNPQDRVSKHDCTAHSAVYTPGTYNIQPLSSSPTLGALPASSVRMELWCRLEEMPTETASPCPSSGTCNWVETTTALQLGRWYASNQQLPDGTVIVVGGRSAFTVEFVPANGGGLYNVPLLTAVTPS
ncbi:unnamed protein product [Sphagnum jensenii]|uniref:Glyoxal oxidase N-terminal domain-containing protein n=1 Tax=Sphagnum jensenii TaxID=128206 RepID=A0ABP1ASB4_9BRYO